MAHEAQYRKRAAELLGDESICSANRTLFREFFEYQEYKLKRQNQLRALDEASYKTLGYYITRLRNVNGWFKNKPWRQLTREDIKAVYDGLEDGVILNSRGKPFMDRVSYYNKIFKSKPFRLAGVSELAREVIEFSTPVPRQVRYVDEATFRKLVSVLSNPRHLLLFWLAWDIGENVGTLLALRKRHFRRQVNPDTGEDEYLVNLPKELLKRSRRQRGEVTLYAETVKYLDMALNRMDETEILFPFGHRQALKIIKQAAAKSGSTTQPDRGRVSWKDLRSGMACHLLGKGWSIEEINARLGHVPSSKAIDAYVTHLAINRHSPKQRLQESAVTGLQRKLREATDQQRLFGDRLKKQAEHGARLEDELHRTRIELQSLRQQMVVLLDRMCPV